MRGRTAEVGELKYLFLDPYREVVAAWIDHACIPDPRYPAGTIWSLYYDTPDLSLYAQTRNGESGKVKLRLRWYTDPRSVDPATVVRCYLEIKRRRGAVRDKERLEVDVEARRLVATPTTDAVLCALPERAGEVGGPDGPLVPVVVIGYERRRYLEGRHSTRISVDTAIRSEHANEGVLPASHPGPLGVGVLEVKGDPLRAEAPLRPIGSYLTRSAFSKYARCLEQLMLPLERRL